MKRIICVILYVCLTSMVWSDETIWRHPSHVSNMTVLENDCWDAIDQQGNFPDECSINPNIYLIGAPPTSKTAISITTDHWIELSFPGVITDNEGPDIIIREDGTNGEKALVLLSDGRFRTYALGIAEIPNTGKPDSTYYEFDICQIDCGFSPTAIRIVSLGLGGDSPGFDVGEVKARVSVNTSLPYLPSPYPGDSIQANDSLHWFPSGPVDRVDVYIGHTPNDVDPALALPIATLPGDVNSFTPDYLWKQGETYYWRVVEHYDSTARLSPCWQFTVAPHLTIDNFETYADTEEIQSKWFLNENTNEHIKLTFDANETYRGCHSMRLDYDCHSNDWTHTYREDYTVHNFSDPNLSFIELTFRGLKSNPPGHTLLFGMGFRLPQNITYDGDPNHIRDGQWHTWRIPLSTFFNRTYINAFRVGVQSLSNTPSSHSIGTLFFDEIRVGSAQAIYPVDPAPLFTDLDQDQQLTLNDLALFSEAWLTSPQDSLSIQEPNAPWCHLPFDGDLEDRYGHAQIHVNGPLMVTQDVNFTEGLGHLEIVNAETLEQSIQGITISFWQCGSNSPHRTDTLVCSNYALPTQAPDLAIGLGLWERPEQFYWQCGDRKFAGNLCHGIHQSQTGWTSTWSHWAFTKDFRTGQLCIYHNGRLTAQSQGLPEPLTNLATLTLGTGWYHYYDGSMDDFMIHNYALSEPECAYLATDGTGILPHNMDILSDFNLDGRVNWQDFAIMSQEWFLNK